MTFLTVNCSIDLTEEELMFVLLSRAKLKAVPWPSPESAGAVVVGPEGVTRDEAGPSRLLEPVEPETTTRSPTDYANSPANYANTPQPEVIPAEPPPLPPKPARSRAKANGAEAPLNSTPLAPPPPPEPLDEPAMRSLLSKVGAVHPLKVKAITDLLEYFGGRRRLSECDPSTWPAIATAAHDLLAEYGA